MPTETSSPIPAPTPDPSPSVPAAAAGTVSAGPETPPGTKETPPGSEETLDLSGEGTVAVSGDPTFTPYVFDRQPGWVLLPLFALLLVAAHLLRLRPAGHRSEIRVAADASHSPLSQFQNPALSPPVHPPTQRKDPS